MRFVKSDMLRQKRILPLYLHFFFSKQEGLNIAQPVLLGALIDFFTQEPTITETEAYIYAMAISVSAILQAILYHPYHFYVSRQGMRIKTACCSLMYRKVGNYSFRYILQITHKNRKPLCQSKPKSRNCALNVNFAILDWFGLTVHKMCYGR